MTQPNRASSLATAIDRVEERMALTELNQETPEDRAVKPTEAALEVTVSAESSVSPEQVLAAARDFSAHRAQIWRNVEAKAPRSTRVRRLLGGRDRRHVFKRGSSWQLQAA